jgi:hypothetical protein
MNLIYIYIYLVGLGQSMGLGTQDSKKYRNIWTLGVREIVRLNI